MFRQFPRKHEPHGRLDFSAGKGSLAAVTHQAATLIRQLIKYVVDEAVHDAHGVLGYAGVWVHLLQHLVDVQREGLSTLLVGTMVVFHCSHGLAGAFISLLYHYKGRKMRLYEPGEVARCLYLIGNLSLIWRASKEIAVLGQGLGGASLPSLSCEAM